MVRIDTCQAGHPLNAENAKLYTHTNGKRYRQCRLCNSRRSKLRYRKDDAFREKEKARNRASYLSRRSRLAKADARQMEQRA